MQKVQEKIQNDMKEKFGLDGAQSTATTDILLNKFKSLLSENSIDSIKNSLQDRLSGASNPIKEKLNKETLNDLITKVGLSEEKAKKISDFSISEYTNQFSDVLSKLENNLDLNQIKDKLNTENLEENAKQLIGNLGKYFKK